jgi:hypothetical protein
MKNRRHKRITEENRVTIELVTDGINDNKGEEIHAFTQDISLGGARILTDRFFPVGTVFKITVFLGRTKKKFQVDGEVRWAKSFLDDGLFSIGLEFLHNVPKSILPLIEHLYGAEENIQTILRL